MTDDFKERLGAVRERMRIACESVGRSFDSVKLVGVTKTVSGPRVREAVSAGLTLFGENYVQEASGKIQELVDLEISWHFIGHLQSNKVKFALRWFELIHSVDRLSLAKELERQAVKNGKAVDILVQVNLGDESTKGGTGVDALKSLVRDLGSLDAVRMRGLMALPPYFDDAERSRPYFRELRMLLNEARQVYPNPELLTELSMGMSHDLEVAIEEGATFVRVGTALFGARG